MHEPVTPRGRFAPSPSGDLHFGSLLAAMASVCDARQQHGEWLLRIDDIDPPRAIPSAIDRIPRSLERLGFTWDALQYQSDHVPAFRDALVRLNEAGRLYACRCTRKSLRGLPAYPGHCRPAQPERLDSTRLFEDTSVAIRCRLDAFPHVEERIQHLDLAQLRLAFGDPIVRRRDGLIAYPLAAAVDDAAPITDVVRGADLLDATPVQVAVMALLGGTPPRYAHIPAATDEAGVKLSKQTGAAPLDNAPALPLLHAAWRFLGQTPVDAQTVTEFWQAALPHWRLANVPTIAQARARYDIDV